MTSLFVCARNINYNGNNNNSHVVQRQQQRRRRSSSLSLNMILKSTTESIVLLSIAILLIVSSSRSSLFVVNASIDVGNGNTFGYVANTDVGIYLKLAYDIRDMRLSNDDMDEKLNIYQNGKNVDITYSLQQLSMDAGTLYYNTPMFQLYQHSFYYLGLQLEQDEIGNFDGQPAGQYADTLVSDLFHLDIPYIEATGSLVLNVVQAYWGQLWNVLNGCRTNNATAMNVALDIAVALYVGSDQSRNENNQGYMLYNLAENAGQYFGQDVSESLVNQRTLDKFLEIQVGIADGMCASPEGYTTMRTMVRSLYQYTNIFLTQWLLYHIQQYNDIADYGGGCDFIELFALSLWPQVHMCNASLGQTILDLTVANDVTNVTVNDAINAVQQSLYCLGISCADVGANGIVTVCNDTENALRPLIVAESGTSSASLYTPTTNVRDVSYLDQDILSIKVFVENNAIDVANDFYQYGWHSQSFSLYNIANNTLPWTSSDMYETMVSYYTPPVSLHSTILKFLDPSSSNNNYFALINPTQRATAVTGLLRGMVMYLGIAGSMESSINACGNNGKDSVIMKLYDSAVALYVGSMATSKDAGISLYAADSTFCIDFNTCDSRTSAYGTVSYMSDSSDALHEFNCDGAFDTLEKNIKPSILVTLLQAYLSSVMTVMRKDDATITEAIGNAYAYSYAIQPYIGSVSPDSATVIKSNTPYTAESQGIINATKAFNAVRNGIKLISNMNCSDLGSYTYNGVKYGLCVTDPHLPDLVANISPYLPQPGTAPAPSPSTPSFDDGGAESTPTTVEPKIEGEPSPDGLAWGRYTFVDEDMAITFSQFTSDIKGMYYATSVEAADVFYNNTDTRNVTVGSNKNVTISSLEEFSTKAYQFMSNDPIYNFFRVALFDDETFDDPTDGDGEDYWAFENAIERLAIGKDNGNSPPLAAETVIVLGIWHMIANLLYEAGRNCMKQTNTPELIDYAVGLWIGQEQQQGKYNSGWSIYYIAQEAAKDYGYPEQEASVNTKLMDEFKEAQDLANKCTDETTGVLMRRKVDDILRHLSVPLVQSLLYHMSNNNFQYVELYALSVIPQAISCDSGAFEYLRDSLFQGYSKESSLDDKLMSSLGKVLHCLRFECADFTSATQNQTVAPSLRVIIDTLCNELDYRTSTSELASFPIQSSNVPPIMELARLDLDVVQTELFTRAGQYNLAYDIYKNGRNSRHVDGGYNTLQKLSSSLPYRGADDTNTLSQKYFGAASTANSTISDVLFQTSGGSSNFTNASRRQRAEIVFRILQTQVSLQGSADKLFEAIDACLAKEKNLELIDEAAALYVGSIEGPDEGGSEDNSGKMMYALGKEFCDDFNKCTNQIDAKSNEIVIMVLSDFRDAIDADECDSALVLMRETILEQMEVPVIQALLYLADVNEGLEGSSYIETIAGGAVVADSLFPLINGTNAGGANDIRSAMTFSVANSTVLADRDVVFFAIRDSLADIGIDCNSIGTFVADSVSVCPANVTDTIAIPANTTTDLGNNVYTTSTYVQDRANIAKDVEEMTLALEDGRQDLARLIYLGGKNSAIYDTLGKRVDLRSLGGFSTGASVAMQSNPLFKMTVFALQDEKKKYGGNDANMYADTIVQEAFQLGKDSKVPLAAEAAVALNLWMQLANELFETVTSCKNGRLTDDTGVQSIDEAAAYWIGDGQIAGSSEKGHLLYALAEEMGNHFGESPEAESRTNNNILSLFHEVKFLLGQTNACNEFDTALRVRHFVDRIISQMIVVQVQALIHYIRTDDKDRVRIYAHAFVPLVVGCNPSVFEYLKAKLLDSPFHESEVEDIVAAIRSTFPCFDLSCDDVGKHETENDILCVDPTPLSSLAAYKPETVVRDYAKLDLDVLELDILIQMEAYEAAEDLYTFGKHASLGSDSAAVSLQSIATSSGRSVVPQFASFKAYYGDDDKYADTWVQKAFDSDSKLTIIQRRALAVGTSRYMIIPMGALQSMYESIGACLAGGSERDATASKGWDMAAAYMVGYLEGSEEAGSVNGELHWHLGKQYCEEFDTCSSEVPGSAVNNDQIKTLLYAGRGAITSANCDELRKAARDLGSKLLVPLIQGLLSMATKLTSRSTSSVDKEILQAEAFAIAQALLPLIQDGDRDVATLIASNFVLDGVSVADGRSAVVSALSSVLPDLGVDCREVGSTEILNACTGDSREEKPVGFIIGIVMGSVALLGLLLLFVRARRKRRPRETKPEFYASNGVLNHCTDLVIYNDSVEERGRSDAETHCLNYADADENMIDDDDAYVNAISRALDERDVQNDQEDAPMINPVV